MADRSHSDESSTPGFGLPSEKRLRHQRDFDQVYADSKHAADDCLVILARRNGLAWSRLGLAISRKVGPAVVRNRWKRLVREAFRRQQHDLPTGLDLVVRPRRGAQPEYQAVARSLSRLTQRLDRWLPPPPKKESSEETNVAEEDSA